MNFKLEKGVNRIVFKVFNYVVKIPNFTHSHLHFLNGCYANWSEYMYCKMFKSMPSCYDKVAPSLFCCLFGLSQIQMYCEPLNRELTEAELDFFSDVRGGETKQSNFGLYKGRVVCLDYP